MTISRYNIQILQVIIICIKKENKNRRRREIKNCIRRCLIVRKDSWHFRAVRTVFVNCECSTVLYARLGEREFKGLILRNKTEKKISYESKCRRGPPSHRCWRWSFRWRRQTWNFGPPCFEIVPPIYCSSIWIVWLCWKLFRISTQKMMMMIEISVNAGGVWLTWTSLCFLRSQ